MIPGCIANIKATPPFSWFTEGDTLQFLMLGAPSAGKTTLLYKLKIDGWKKKEIIPTMSDLRQDSLEGCKDPAYHYEELICDKGNYGIWEVPGYPVMQRMWPMFYRYLRMDAVIYVVDAFSHWPSFGRVPAEEEPRLDEGSRSSKKEEKKPAEPRSTPELAEEMHQAKRQIEFLLNEEELRCAAFVLVLNTSFPLPENLGKEDMEKDATARHEGLCEALFDMIGVPEFRHISSDNGRGRFHAVAFNCSEITRDNSKWKEVLKHIYEVYREVGEGSRFGGD